MLNSVSLTGRLTKEPEVFRTANELDIVRFTLAVNRVFKNKTGQRETDFIECVIFGKRALTFAGSTTKGSLLGISGRLSNNHFENKQGERAPTTTPSATVRPQSNATSILSPKAHLRSR